MSEASEEILPVIKLWLKALIREVVEEAEENKRDLWSDRERAEHCGL